MATPRFATAFHGSSFSARDQCRDQCHPADAHHPEREQRRHQRPATAHAPGAVIDPHPQGSTAARPPVIEDEPQWASALPQAGVLERGQLIDGGPEDHTRRPRSARPRPRRGTRDRARRRGRRSRRRAAPPASMPRGSRRRTIAVAPLGVASPLSRFPRCTRAYMTTIGAIEGNIIAAIITTQMPRNQPSSAEAGPRAGVHVPACARRSAPTPARRRAAGGRSGPAARPSSASEPVSPSPTPSRPLPVSRPPARG